MRVSCYEYAISYLSRYPKTVYELDMQLKKKGYSEDERNQTTEQLQQIGLLDDRLYAEMYLHSEVGRKGKPLFVIQQKLWQKGVEKEITASLIEEMEEELTAGQQAKLEKEVAKQREKGLEERKIQQKLQARGYAFGLVKACMEASTDI